MIYISLEQRIACQPSQSSIDRVAQGASRLQNICGMVTLPFKDQQSANSVKRQMQILSANIGFQIKPVFQSKKIGQILALKETKPPIVNNQCVVYKFECDLCDADYVGYTARHLHHRINEHKFFKLFNFIAIFYS